MDHLMAVNLLTGLTPQQTIWAAMHQDYSSRYVWEEIQEGKVPSDEKAGELIVKHLLHGNRGHFGPLEQMGITVACGYMPHSLMQQLRTHRIAVSFDVMSFRYNSEAIIDVACGKGDIEKIVYLRPVGHYTNRQGKRYRYTQELRDRHLSYCKNMAMDYAENLTTYGLSEEHARGLLPFDLRQHFVLSFNNLRSLQHMLDLRWKADAQLEAQWFCDLLWEATKDIAPVISDWYLENRAKKAKLAP